MAALNQTVWNIDSDLLTHSKLVYFFSLSDSLLKNADDCEAHPENCGNSEALIAKTASLRLASKKVMSL
jgi:hypothetical protein